MNVDAEQLDVRHDPNASRFQIEVGKWMAVLEYEMEGNVMVFTHTGVPRPLEAQGIASRMAKYALDYARDKSFKVYPACEFMVVYLRRHKEYDELINRE